MLWQEPEQINVPEEIRQFVGGHSLIASHLLRNGFSDTSAIREFLDPHAYKQSSPFELPDTQRAVDRLNRAIKGGESILIWGDFDVDGQTAAALLYSALRNLGASVRYHIPLRDGEGHGMFLPRLREWLAREVDVIITCDTGITSHEAVAVAQTAGTDVIITDHHLPGDTLPEALAVINPMLLDEGHKLRELPGVGVAFELISALAPDRNCDNLLDLVALGIVADVALQRNETRYLLQRGLEVMRLSTRAGLRALLQVSEIDQLVMNETDIAFGLAPRLNAQGRLADAKDSVELLTTDDRARAAELAYQLEGMNARRKLESRLVEESAHSLIERDPSLLEYAVIVLSHPDWSGGIVGIVANRLADFYHKPVVMLCEKDDIAFGSARSVPGYNISDALRSCRRTLMRFGGHAMAAGLTLNRDDVFQFRRMLSRAVREMAPEIAEEPTLAIDGYLTLDEISIELAEDLRRLAPFGNGNPPLTLASIDLHLARSKKIGRKGEHHELIVEDRDGNRQRVMWWNRNESVLPEGKFDLAYTLRISRYKNRTEALPELVDFRLLEAETIEAKTEGSKYLIEDFSDHPNPRIKLYEVLKTYPDAVVWREDDQTVEGLDRNSLRKTSTLILWTIPPGPEEWDAGLETTSPRRIIVFGNRPSEATLELFLKRVGGMLKFVIGSKDGETTINELAAAMAQRAATIRYGLKWFHDSGRLNIEIRPDETVRIDQVRTTISNHDTTSLEALLRNILEETAAYRKNWRPDTSQ